MNNFDQVSIDITTHLHPEFLKRDYKGKVDTKGINRKKLEEYNILLMAISQAYKKVMRYELYFSEFYPDSQKIRKSEALEHHVHAYLEDLIILRNKLIVFLGVLKNDLKKVATNKKEIEKALNFIVGQVQKTFDNVSLGRDPHHHKGTKFIDTNLVDSEFAHTILNVDKSVKDTLNPEFLEKLKKREIESFEKAKTKWIKIAQNNNPQISGLIDELFKRNNDFIYKFLNIKKLVELSQNKLS